MLDPPLLNVTVPAKALQGEVSRFKACLGEKSLGDGRHKRQHVLGRFALLWIRGVVNDIYKFTGVAEHHAAAFQQGLLGQQHAPHIRVDNDGVCRAIGVLGAGYRAHLQPVLGVGQGLLVAQFHMPDALHGCADSGGVHKREHRLQALVGLPEQVGLRVIKIHDAGGIPVDTHLVFDGAASNAITVAQGAVLQHVEFRNDEQGDAFDPDRCIGQPCQHDVNNVFGQVVLA